jgi:hypothetical protein
MKKTFSNKICAAIVVLILAMFLPHGANAQGMKRPAKKYHYVQGETHDQFLPVLLYDNGVSSPSFASPHVQVWAVFLPAVKGGKISNKKGYYFTFYLKTTGSTMSFDDVYDGFFSYRYGSKGDYFSVKGTKVPRTIRNEMKSSGVPDAVVKQLRKDQFRLATEYLAYMQNVGSGGKIDEENPQKKK